MTAAFPGDHDAGIRVLGDGRPRRGVPARLLRLASDERLVEHIRAGSEAAFEALFDRHHRGVLGFCRHMLGSLEEAEDAVQHTFLSAYRELVRSRKQVALRPWLYTIARNRCLTMLRSRARHVAGELQEPPTEHLAAAVERRHELHDLLRDVAGLPEDQRAALVLSELGDMSHDEIAAVVGCRRDKVKALVFQARSSLIASRKARETPCAEIREQLANLRGGSLRRNELRRHLHECAGCREFRAQVRSQRRDLAVILPVAPTIGLKSAVVGAALGGSTGAGAVAGGGATVAVTAKVVLACAIAGGGTVAVRAELSSPDKPAARESRAAPVTREPARTDRRADPAAAPLVAPAGVAPSANESTPPAKGSTPGHASRPGRERGRGATPGRRAKPGHGANPRQGANPGHGANPGQGANPGNGSNPGRGSKPAKSERSPEAAKPGKPLNAGKAEQPRAAAKPDRPLNAGKAEQPRAAVKPENPGRLGKPGEPVEAAKPGKAVTPPAPAAPVTPGAGKAEK